jgi:hypothetical protein
MHLATMPPALIALSLLLLTVSLVTVSWFITQAGTLYMVAPCVTIDLVGGVAGTQPFSTGRGTRRSGLEALFYRDTRELLLPELLSGAKVADSAGFLATPAALRHGRLGGGGAGGLAGRLAVAAVPPRRRELAEQPVGVPHRPGTPAAAAGGVATAPLPGAWSNGFHVVGGLAGVTGILALRARTGLALHPIGFLGASTISGRTLWFSVLLGWACKALISRYGGMRGYRAALPLFLGLMLGDVLNAVVWIGIGALTGTVTTSCRARGANVSGPGALQRSGAREHPSRRGRAHAVPSAPTAVTAAAAFGLRPRRGLGDAVGSSSTGGGTAGAGCAADARRRVGCGSSSSWSST